MLAEQLLDEPPVSFKKAIPIPAMVSGQCKPLRLCADPLLTQGMWGPGLAVETNDSKICAPFDGVVVSVDALNYSLTIKSRFGLKCFIKYGDDTSHLLAQQFTCPLTPGKKFKKGELLFSVNNVWLKQQGVANICIMTVLNAQALLGVMTSPQRSITAGQDSLLTLYI